MENVNIVKIAGKIAQIKDVWQGDKGKLIEVLLEFDDGKHALFNTWDTKLEEGFGVGASVQVVGGLEAKQGKTGDRYFQSVIAKKIIVVVAAPKKDALSEKSSSIQFEDDVPF